MLFVLFNLSTQPRKDPYLNYLFSFAQINIADGSSGIGTDPFSIEFQYKIEFQIAHVNS